MNNNLTKLQRYVWNLGMFSGVCKLNITLESQFEGFSGRASEDWEKQVTIELSELKDIHPTIKVVGFPLEDIDMVAGKVLKLLEISKPSHK